MPTDPPPQWQPISMLPTIAFAIDSMLESATENLANLEAVRSQPGALEDVTVKHVIQISSMQRDDMWL